LSQATFLPDWMPQAHQAAHRLRATTTGTKGASHKLYVVLLKDSRAAGRWGLYVGETSLDPDMRFDQHKTGYKASRYVNRFGIRLLPQLFEHFNPLRQWEAVELEPVLAEAFRAAGVPWVEGGH
jgi:predicted GIY-YIG superfamily endonuclease